MALVGAGCGARFPRTATTAGGGTNNVAAGDQTGADQTATGATETTLAGTVAAVTTIAGRSSVTAPGSGGAASGPIDPGVTQGVTATTIKIGYLLPLHGAAPVPVDFKQGAVVYWNYVNSKGGINGRKVDIVIRDTMSSAQTGKDEAKALIEQDKVFAIVVFDRLENAEALGQYLDARHFPNVEIQTPANLPKTQTWTFGVTLDHAVQGTLIANYFVKVLNAKKAAVVYENTAALEPGVQAFKKEMTRLGGEVVYSAAVDGQENDFSQQALALSQKNAPVCWLYMAPTPVAKLANQADAANYHPVWFGNSISFNFDLVFGLAPKALRGARAFSPWVALSDPRTDTYKQAYQSQTNQPADDIGLIGWGVGEIVGKGIELAGKQLGQNSFRAAMQAMKYSPDIWAPISFGPSVRDGVNTIAVLKEAGTHWDLDRNFTSSF
jgi:branched-chain amino acid transport system substrate-binding protein